MKALHEASAATTKSPTVFAYSFLLQSPLAIGAAAFAVGIWVAGHVARAPLTWAMASALVAFCAIAGAVARHARIAQVAALLALVGAGAYAREYTPAPNVVIPPAEFLGAKNVKVVGCVTNDGAAIAGGFPRERFDLQAKSLQLEGAEFSQPVGIRASLFLKHPPRPQDGSLGPAQFPPLAYGDCLVFPAKLRLPRNFHNPGAFDHEGYLRGLGIGTLASVAAEDVKMLPEKSRARLGFWRSRIRRSVLDHINAASFDNPKNALWSKEDAAIFSAMIIGDDSLLLRNVREEFQETGVYHLLVVSGMNVALLAFAVFWLARKLRAPPWAASLITIALAAFYAYVAGMGVPIMRAVLMLSVYLVGRLFYRERQSFNATGLAALVVLVISPNALFEAGFQLTFLALVAIAGISVPLLERTSTPYRRALLHLDSTAYDLNLEPRLAQFRLDMRLVAERLAAFLGRTLARWLVVGAVSAVVALLELITVSTVTQAVLVVPMRAYFHRAAVIGMPANVLVLPLAGVMLNSGVAAIALSYVSLPLARVAGFIAASTLHWTLGCLQWLAAFHISQWRMPDVSVTIAVLAALGVLFALATIQKRRRVAVLGLAGLFVTAGFAAFFAPRPSIEPGKLEVTAIDVGQGDSLLIVSPQGRTMLIDGGSGSPVHSEFDFGEDVVSPYLWSRGLKQLDVVVLTHAHGDHIGGLERVVRNFQPRELWVGTNPETDSLRQLLLTAEENHVSVKRHLRGDAIEWGGAHLQVMAPLQDREPRSQPKNDDSLVLLVSYGQTSALLAGDVEKAMERILATETPHVDLLKVAHHGSATSTTGELLAAAQPTFAVISVGYRNQFGHPRYEVLERLQQAHVRTYRTDLQGAVTFLLDGRTVTARQQ